MSRAVPPGPRGRAFVGMLATARRDPLRFLLHAADAYGDVVYFTLAGLPVYLLNHPDDIEEVLVTAQDRFVKGRSLSGARQLFGNGLLTSDGEAHARQRRIVQPAFQRCRHATYAQIMTAAAAEQTARWQDGDRIDITSDMSRLTLAIAARALFGSDGDAIAAVGHGVLTDAMHLLDVPALPFGELLDRLNVRRLRRLRLARARLGGLMLEVVGCRRRRGGGDDLLSMLLAAHDAGMPEEQLLDEMITLLLAGHDTTANALAWTWLLLARHPGVEQRLLAEIDSVAGGGELTADHMSSLAFTRMVLAEAMRLYPPAWLLGRVALADHPVRGHVVPARSLVIISPWAVQRNAAFFPEPHAFRPDRWSNGDNRPRFSYFPFGGGSRGCMGESFAWAEGVLILATIAQRWRLQLVGETFPAPRPAMTLTPGAASMRVRQRNA